jgi:hypothetical protein
MEGGIFGHSLRLFPCWLGFFTNYLVRQLVAIEGKMLYSRLAATFIAALAVRPDSLPPRPTCHRPAEVAVHPMAHTWPTSTTR